jgi:hypothetical protein
MRKRNIPKQRNLLVPLMRLHCKPGPHNGKKLQSEGGEGRRLIQAYWEELSAPAKKTYGKIANSYQTEGERP